MIFTLFLLTIGFLIGYFAADMEAAWLRRKIRSLEILYEVERERSGSFNGRLENQKAKLRSVLQDALQHIDADSSKNP